MALSMSALGLPFSPNLFWIHDAGSGKTRRGAGCLAGYQAAAALPSISSGRIRPGPL